MKTQSKISILVSLLLFATSAIAQIKVTSSGNVGIGTTVPLKKFHVSGGDAIFQCGPNKNLEIENWNLTGDGCITINAHNDPNTLHIPLTFAASKFYFHTGIVGIGRNPFFKLDVDGDLRVNSIIFPTNEKFMKIINPITYEFEKLRFLKGVAYNFVNEEKSADTSLIKDGTKNQAGVFEKSKDRSINFHYGFIAEEFKELYPELVYEDKDGVLGIDYVSLIALINEELKYNKEKIEKLSQEMDSLKTSNIITSLFPNKDKSRGELYQNTPNPFNKSTVIKFRLAENTLSAEIYLYNLQGKQIRSYRINNANDPIIVNASELGPGIYLYSLIGDGVLIDTKTMILTR